MPSPPSEKKLACGVTAMRAAASRLSCSGLVIEACSILLGTARGPYFAAQPAMISIARSTARSPMACAAIDQPAA